MIFQNSLRKYATSPKTSNLNYSTVNKEIKLHLIRYTIDTDVWTLGFYSKRDRKTMRHQLYMLIQRNHPHDGLVFGIGPSILFLDTNNHSPHFHTKGPNPLRDHEIRDSGLLHVNKWSRMTNTPYGERRDQQLSFMRR